MRLALVVLIGCSRAPIATCKQDLTGEYEVEGQRWMLVDHGDTLEGYPLFPDVPAVGTLEIAPRVLDLGRNDDGLAGRMRRRYMRGAASCTGHGLARITVCADDALDIVVAEPQPPVGWEPKCTWAPGEPARRERWLRQ